MIAYSMNKMPAAAAAAEISTDSVRQARKFHSSFPEYSLTPLVNAAALSKALGLGEIRVKDESKRFGLNAFKVLGASYAMGKYLAKSYGIPDSDLRLDAIKAAQAARKPVHFYAATDGNHGRAVAWTAAKLCQPASIYMPKGSSEERLQNIQETGAYAEITDMNYDNAVRFAAAQAEKTGGVIIQDTAWEGYEDIPLDIMEGYGVIADEVLECGFMPTHVFLQAGVGSFAGGITGAFRAYCKAGGGQMPRIIVAESDRADCYYRSALAADGKPRFVGGEMRTLMAGLACGEPNPIAFDILRNEAACFVSCGDKVAADGMRILSSLGVTSGESGAVTCGLLAHICLEMPELKTALGLDERSRVLLISTEGDTDRQRYRDIVWFGRNEL